MKKILSILLIAVVIFVLYQHQKPTLSTEEAVVQAYEHLKNPPSEFLKSLPPIQIELDDIPGENIQLQMRPQGEFPGRLFNHLQWEVTISYEDVVPTIVMDAVTGEILDIVGPLN
ncbi:hypothetical protein [Planococcus sp. CAU13]|uniref:hypothetical protein n=1 Tax=Planococcus sp. CAU13 TaxID=1541197 RepID=UPI00052FEB3F|nr:hypothetical protein [Planococcus sp. CAU13]